MSQPAPERSFETLLHLLERVAARQDEIVVSARPAPGEPYEDITATELCDRIEAAATGLVAAGAAPGAKVALILPGSPTWHILDFAIMRAGCTAVPAHYYLTAEELAWILVAAEASVVLLDEGARWDEIAGHGDGLPAVTHVFAADDDCASQDSRLRPLSSLAAEPGSHALPTSLAPDSVATILYTSGTTGQPKGVLLTHANLMAAVAACQDRQPVDAGRVAASFLPLSHVLEKVVTLVYFACGTRIAYSSPTTLLGDLADIRPHYLVGVPRVFEKIRARALGSSAVNRGGMRRKLVDVITRKGRRALGGDGADDGGRLGQFTETVADRLMGAIVRRRLGGRLERVICGGAPLEADLVPFFVGLGIDIYEGYGLSETAAVVCITPPEGIVAGSVGTAVMKTEVRVVEDEQWVTFRTAAEGDDGPQIGEIQVRGPQVFPGYKDLPDATAAAFTADGWFRTGDLGTIDERGYVRLYGRSKHVLVTSWGKKVTPTPMEEAFATSPFIERAVVVGEGRPFLMLLVEPGLENLAALARSQGLEPPRDAPDLAARLDLAGLRAVLWTEITARQENLSRPEQVQAFRILPDPLSIEDGTLTATLKVRRHVVIERHRALIEDAYAHGGKAR